jgi:hypothetical protein
VAFTLSARSLNGMRDAPTRGPVAVARSAGAFRCARQMPGSSSTSKRMAPGSLATQHSRDWTFTFFIKSDGTVARRPTKAWRSGRHLDNAFGKARRPQQLAASRFCVTASDPFLPIIPERDSSL